MKIECSTTARRASRDARRGARPRRCRRPSRRGSRRRVMPTTSVAVTSRICERRAPDQVSRRRTSRWSRRSRVEASTAKPSRSTAASPPRMSRRSAATRLVARIAAIVPVGATTVKMSERSSSCDCARSSRVLRLASCQSWIDRGATGTIQPYVREMSGASGSGVWSNGHDAVGEQDRRPLAAARAEVGGERRAGLERRTADDVQERELRRRRRAADLDQLAVRRRAAARQAAAAKVEPAREPVDRAEVDERPAPRRLAEDEHAERLLAEDRRRRARARCGSAART